VDESWHICEWAMPSKTTDTRRYEWIMSRIEYAQTCHTQINLSHLVMLFIQMVRGTHVNESYDMYEWVTSHLWMCQHTDSLRIYECIRDIPVTYLKTHVTYMNDSPYTYEGAKTYTHLTIMNLTKKYMSYVWMSHNVYMNDSPHTYECTKDIYVTYMNDSCQIYVWLTSHLWMYQRHMCHMYEHFMFTHATCMNGSCHTGEWVMSHIWMTHVTHMNVSRHVTHINMSRLTYRWVMSHMWMSHGPHVNESSHIYEWLTSHIWMCRDLSYTWICHV